MKKNRTDVTDHGVNSNEQTTLYCMAELFKMMENDKKERIR